MKRGKCTILLVMTAFLTMLLSSGAFALGPAGYVPTKAKVYEYDTDTKKWEQIGTDTLSFSSDGKIKSITKDRRLAEEEVEKSVYSWSGNLVKKVVTSTKSSSGKDSSTVVYKYQDGKLISETHKGGSLVEPGVVSYTWEGNKTTGDMPTLEVNSSHQLISKSWISCLVYKETNKYTYYKNGNLKKLAFTDAFTSGKVIARETYNYQKNGFPKSVYRTEGKKKFLKEAYSYKTKKGKIQEIQVTVKDGYTTKYKYVITKWKKVSHMRNHDAFGLELPLY